MIPREAHYPQIDKRVASVLRERDLELFGVASVQAPDLIGAAEQATSDYDRWIDRGLHGGMAYLARHVARKYNAGAVLPGCRSVIVVGLNYFQEAADPTGDPERGRVARYAWGRDYHNAIGKRLRRAVRELRSLFPGETFRFFVDASPLSERFFAEHANVGYTARNTLTISSAYGSWFFLAEILTTAGLGPTPPEAASRLHGGCPSSCFRCGDVCPTNALYDHHRIDASRCISYLTIEHRGPIPEELRPQMGTWLFGCDLCQEVCPLNIRAVPTRLADFTAHRAGPELDLRDLLQIPDERTYNARFEGTPLRRPGRSGMLRNACIAAANAGATDLLPHLQRLSSDTDHVIRDAASWATQRLQEE